MPGSITSYTFQVYGVLHPANAPLFDIVAGLIRALKNPKPLPTVLQHLRHEWEIVQAALFVQSCQDLIPAPDLDPFSGLQLQARFRA